MKTFFKIIFLLILLIALFVVGYYNIYRDTVYENLRRYLSERISEETGYPVTIGKVQYLPPQSLVLEGFAVLPKEGGNKAIMQADSVKITFDLFEFLKERRLKTTIVVDKGMAEKASFGVTLKTSSLIGKDYREALSPALIEQIFVVDGDLEREGLELGDIFGTINISGLRFTSCKLHMEKDALSYLLTLEALEPGQNRYSASLRSHHLGLQSTFIKDGSNLVFDSIRGMSYILRFDLKAEVRNVLAPEMSVKINGAAKADLSSWNALPAPFGGFARTYPMRGSLDMLLNFSCYGEDFSKYEMNATLSGARIKIGTLHFDEITTKLSVNDGRLSSPLINGVFYGGNFSGELAMDLLEKDFPYIFKGVLNGADLYRLARDINGNKENLYGTLNADLSLKGYTTASETAEGHGSVTVTNGNLGLMPILTPLLGDLYLTLEKAFPSPDQMRITGGYLDFDIRDRKILTDDLTLMGDELSITGKGSLDFDGKLDFSFTQEVRVPIELSRDDDWQTTFRNVLIKAGKMIKKARLTGTLDDPKWGL